MARAAAKRIPDQRLPELLGLIGGADSVELKLTVPESDAYETVAALGLDPLDGEIRQVFFFDTPDLRLRSQGVVVRARRVQRKGGDAVVKLRPVEPDKLPASLRKAPGFTVEVDAMPGGFVCSGTLKCSVDNAHVREVAGGDRRLRKLLSKDQRRLLDEHAPAGVTPNDLAILGPIHVLKLKCAPAGFGRRLVAELWMYPDGSRILELSTKCAPGEAFQVAAETRAFLTERGVDVDGEQETKTMKALDFFARRLAER
jgi:hypothetical protein